MNHVYQGWSTKPKGQIQSAESNYLVLGSNFKQDVINALKKNSSCKRWRTSTFVCMHECTCSTAGVPLLLECTCYKTCLLMWKSVYAAKYSLNAYATGCKVASKEQINISDKHLLYNCF